MIDLTKIRESTDRSMDMIGGYTREIRFGLRWVLGKVPELCDEIERLREQNQMHAGTIEMYKRRMLDLELHIAGIT